ncbi:MAG: hypothetical protein JWQ36_3505 [Enterovirga sp.]|nr:hypothetical protein [Enterovirga sp.]
MSVIGTAKSGMAAATQRFEASAARVAQGGTADGKDADLAKEAAEIAAAKVQVAANAAVIRTGSKTVGALIDILA